MHRCSSLIVLRVRSTAVKHVKCSTTCHSDTATVDVSFCASFWNLPQCLPNRNGNFSKIANKCWSRAEKSRVPYVLLAQHFSARSALPRPTLAPGAFHYLHGSSQFMDGDLELDKLESCLLSIAFIDCNLPFALYLLKLSSQRHRPG